VIVIVPALLIVAITVAVIYFAKFFTRRQRVVYWIVVALATAYFAPRLFQAGAAGYRKGAEIRQQQGR
jgi:hypothetical protein